MGPLNIFYEEPDPDRWVVFDRYPRRVIRRIVRGKRSPGGQQRVFFNLIHGLDLLGVDYRINDYRWLRRHPSEVACVVGKPHVLDKFPWSGPILFGAGVFSHPIDDPSLCERLPVKKILVPGEWTRKMFEPYYGELVSPWPVGIDTDLWSPGEKSNREIDFLIYDKVLWQHEQYERELIRPIEDFLVNNRLRVQRIRYGGYREEQFFDLLKRSRAMVFLCEHETQGIAYQQALSCGVPILAWDRGGFWQDPKYFPDLVKFGPVSSVPYWDDRCGVRFENTDCFPERFTEFWERLNSSLFSPRDFILENLTLEICAEQYLKFHTKVLG